MPGRLTYTASTASLAIALLAGLVGACGDGATPTAPSTLDGGVTATLAVERLGVAGAPDAFASAPDTATLKVTAPTPTAPTHDSVVASLSPTLRVAMSAGQYVDAPGLRIGFALWQVGADGAATLVEAHDVPQTAPDTTYVVGSMLDYDTQYRWRSRAVLEDAYGPWSTAVSFRSPGAPPPSPPTTPPLPAESEARYRAVFESDWSATTHPVDYPDNAHYSPILVATHLAGTTFWQSGMLASSGIERMAEEGSPSPFDAEVAAAIATGAAEFFVRGGGLEVTPGVEHAEFDVTTAFPYVTLVSMIAPSPDWFVGVNGLPLIANGQWRDEVVIQLFPWDAGTDNGATFASADADAVPAQPISLLQRPPVQVDGTVQPFGRLIFRRLN